MFGTRFGDLDYYVFVGNSPADVLGHYVSFVGTPRLKPRYVLGYHQGCYGYESREMLEQAARAYREHGIPIDGLHIDVDLQHNYQTFTINESAFPNPKEMFSRLRQAGFKCSTNITPIISSRDPNYKTYATGLANGYFVKDIRFAPAGREAEVYQDFDGGREYCSRERDVFPSNYNTGKPYIGEVYYGSANGVELGTEGHYPDFGRKEVREWWGKQYRYLFDMGLEMVWQDMTTPAVRPTRGDMCSFPFKLMLSDDFDRAFQVDGLLDSSPTKLSPAITVWNLFAFNLHKATYEGLNALPGRENKRNFIIGRGSFAGVSRYAGLWTGDNASTWDFLRISVAQVLSIGLSGEAITGADVGGFEQGQPWEKWPDPELLIRWTAAGAFLPWFRNHYIRKGHKLFQEPYAYAYLDLKSQGLEAQAEMYQAVLPICKYFIELRYRLLPLFYDALFENTLNGLPICRALFLVEQRDKAIFNDKVEFVNNQFFVGHDLLVAPILEPQHNENGWGKRDVYLPAGSLWYAFMDNRRPLDRAIPGGATIYAYDAHINRDPNHIPAIVPVFVRAGAVVPTVEVEQYVGERHRAGLPHPITLNIYPGATGTYVMYLDDGESRSSAPEGDPALGADPAARSEYREVHITHAHTAASRRTIRVVRKQDKFTPKEDFYFVAILHDPGEVSGPNGPLTTVAVDGLRIPLVAGLTAEERSRGLGGSTANAYYYNEGIRISFIKVFDTGPAMSIELQYRESQTKC